MAGSFPVFSPVSREREKPVRLDLTTMEPSGQPVGADGVVRLCKIQGCTRYVQKRGVCITHGARRTRCKVDGCEKGAVRGGVCKAHGAKMKGCATPGCIRQAVRGGLCIAHGAQVKRCKVEGCGKHCQRGGVCVAHGAKVKRCSVEGCGKYSVRGGVCVSHGAKVQYKRCKQVNCTRNAQKGGFCATHNAEKMQGADASSSSATSTKQPISEEAHILASMKQRKLPPLAGGSATTACTIMECSVASIIGSRDGFCLMHERQVLQRHNCAHASCPRYAKIAGVCLLHGSHR